MQCRCRSLCLGLDAPPYRYGRQAADGGFVMLLGDGLTTVQENLPIKIVVFDNGKLGFVDIEQKISRLDANVHGLEEP